MRRFNKILATFFVFILILLGAAWAFLQSRLFAEMISKTITEVSSRQLNAEVKFDRVSLRFFPPGLALENVRLKYSKDGTSIEGQAGELGVSFSYDSFSGRKPRLHQIFLREGWASLKIPDSESKGEHPWDILQRELAKFPVEINSIHIAESRIEVMGLTVDIHSLNAVLGKKVISVLGEIKDFQHKDHPQRLDLATIEGQLRRDDLAVKSAAFVHKRSVLKATGQVTQWADLKTFAFTGKITSELYLPDIEELVSLDPVIFESGFLSASGTASWSKAQGTKASLDLRAFDIKSNVVTAQVVEAKVTSAANVLRLEALQLKNNDEQLSLLTPAEVWNQNSGALLAEGVRARLVQFEIPNALTILGDRLKPLRGRMTGDVSFRLQKNDMFFKPADGFKIEQLGLRQRKEDGSPFDVVRAPVVWFSDSKLSVENGIFRMDAQVRAPRSQFSAKGQVGRGQVHFDVGPGPINLADFGDIAELGLKGEGENSIKARGSLDQVTMTMEGKLRNFEIVGYRLGETQHQFIVDLGKSTVTIPRFAAKKSRYVYSGTGKVDWKDFLMDISVDLPEISFAELKDAVHPISGGLGFLPADFEGTLQGSIELYAKGSMKNFVASADVYGQKLRAWGESFRDTKFALLYKDSKISLDSFSVTKELGKLSGTISHDLTLSRTDYKLSLRGLTSGEVDYYKRLTFALDFSAGGEFQGWHRPREWHHRGFLGLSGSRVLDRTLPDSTFEWDIKQDTLAFDAKIARDWVVVSAQSSPDTRSRRINADFEANIPDLPLFIMAGLGENVQLMNASGAMAFKGNLGVTNWEWNRLDLQGWLRHLSLKTAELDLNERYDRPQIAIRGGRVDTWDLRIQTPDLKLASSADGDFKQNLVIKNVIDVDAKYLEILSPHVQRAEGRASAQIKAILTPKDLSLTVESSAQKLNVSLDVLPFTLSDLQYSLRYAEKELELKQFSFRPESGLVKATGSAMFRGFDPEVNLRWYLETATIPFKGRSNVTLTGNGMLFGNRRPYVLSGEVVINKGNVLNEVSDFTSDTSASADTKYMPREKGGAIAGLANFDLSVRAENPINISNSMMDVDLVGDVILSGDLMRPSADGRVHTIGNSSKVFFKNSEYQITKGEFLFNGRKPVSRPDFDVSAASTISNYRVTAKAYGNPENFTFDLTSDPPLSRQNILSLIAFGYTDDLSDSIRPEDRQSLTNIGVGSFIFDQFKVTDIVKKQFGLQVNLGTVFMQSNESMLAGRSGDQAGATGLGGVARTRTATNIEVKKRLSEAMNLSVSSTVGGSIGQRQRMTLNYGLSRSVELEGIYELRTNADGFEDPIDNSIGGDVKFRMNFR